MKIAILGYSSQGIAALEYWGKADNQLTVHDSRKDITLPEGIQAKLGPDYLADLGGYDLIVRGAPSIHPRDIVAANSQNPSILDKVTTVTNEFFKVCPSRNIIGVTGTKGKGTTSTLISKLLEAAGKTVHLGGNIGIPPLDMLKSGIKPDDWVVLELANFQLIDLKMSPHIAVCLMVVPEHLDWHADVNEYVQAKQQLFAHQVADDVVVFNRANDRSKKVSSVSPATKLSYEVPKLGQELQQTTGAYLKGDTIYMDDTPVCKTSDVALLGRHNLENVCAAVATTWELVGHNVALIKKVIGEFKGLEHRLELVRELNGIKYYNDSFASAAGATIAAIAAIPGIKIMIVGGFERNLELDSLAQALVEHQADIRKALLIGDTAQRLAKSFDKAGFTNYEILTDVNMPQIVAKATSIGQTADSIVLSPGFASFDMFKNFEDRGQQYQAAVKAL